MFIYCRYYWFSYIFNIWNNKKFF